METKRQHITAIYNKINKAEQELIDYVNENVFKAGELPLLDVTNDDDGSVRWSVVSEDNDYVYNPTFDRIKAEKDKAGNIQLMFHVKDGDSWEHDGSWVDRYNFSSNDEWKGLIDYIIWPDD